MGHLKIGNEARQSTEHAHHFLFQEQHFALQSLQVRGVVLIAIMAFTVRYVRRFVVLVVTFPTSKRPYEAVRDFSSNFGLYVLKIGEGAGVLVHGEIKDLRVFPVTCCGNPSARRRVKPRSRDGRTVLRTSFSSNRLPSRNVDFRPQHAEMNAAFTPRPPTAASDQ